MPSDLYDRLRAITVELIESMNSVPTTGQPDPDRIRAARTDDYVQHYGFHYYTTIARPGEHVSMTTQGLIDHLIEAGSRYQGGSSEILSILVDEERKETALRIMFHLQPKGVDEVVPYEVSWLLEMNEDGTKVKKATEFIDSHAADRITELLKIGQLKA